MKVQREGRSPVNLPDKVAMKLISRGVFKAADEVEEEVKPVKKVRKSAKKK